VVFLAFSSCWWSPLFQNHLNEMPYLSRLRVFTKVFLFHQVRIVGNVVTTRGEFPVTQGMWAPGNRRNRRVKSVEFHLEVDNGLDVSLQVGCHLSHTGDKSVAAGEVCKNGRNVNGLPAFNTVEGVFLSLTGADADKFWISIVCKRRTEVLQNGACFSLISADFFFSITRCSFVSFLTRIPGFGLTCITAKWTQADPSNNFCGSRGDFTPLEAIKVAIYPLSP
jgi:hypothetical protein